jgi:hypothetical protein
MMTDEEHIMLAVIAVPPVAAPCRFDLVTLIRSEYLEMPGLCLTLPQAAKLWNVDDKSCSSALEALTRQGFLYCSRGMYLRGTAEKFRGAGEKFA